MTETHILAILRNSREGSRQLDHLIHDFLDRRIGVNKNIIPLYTSKLDDAVKTIYADWKWSIASKSPYVIANRDKTLIAEFHHGWKHTLPLGVCMVGIKTYLFSEYQELNNYDY